MKIFDITGRIPESDFVELLPIFLIELEESLTVLRQLSLGRNDLKQLQSIAHKTTGLASAYCAMRVYHYGGELEGIIIKNELEGLAEKKLVFQKSIEEAIEFARKNYLSVNSREIEETIRR